MCRWPGPEGQQLLLSALLRQPMACVLLQQLPATGGYQAAFLASAPLGGSGVTEPLALLVVSQLMPPGPLGLGPESYAQIYVR